MKNSGSWSGGDRGKEKSMPLALGCVVAGKFSVTGAYIREHVMMSDEAGVI